MSNLELARAAYDLLVNKHPEGLSRSGLALALKTDDRSARDAVNGCRVLAAERPHPMTGQVWIIGFDPETSRYVAARDPYQARRIIAYQESRGEGHRAGAGRSEDGVRADVRPAVPGLVAEGAVLMPIRPENKARYPDNWKEISHRIRFGRANGKCEQCGVAHNAVGYREPDGTFAELSLQELANGVAEADGSKVITIVLTTAHLNHDPSDCRDENLAAWCQRCHLHYDREHHRRTQLITNFKKRYPGFVKLVTREQLEAAQQEFMGPLFMPEVVR
jgi:hypothetical protein